MIDSNINSKDLNVEMTEGKSQFHFNHMRQYADAVVQSLRLMETYEMVLPVPVTKSTQGVLQFALDNAIHYTRLLKSKLATLPPRTRLKMCRIPDRRKKGSKEEANSPVPRCPIVRLEGEANFPISTCNTRSRKANSLVSDNKNGSVREANLSISTDSIMIRKTIINTKLHCSNKTKIITSNVPEIIDIPNNNYEDNEAAMTLLQLKYSSKVDVALENKEGNLSNNVPAGGQFEPPERSYTSQTENNFGVIKTHPGTDIIKSVHRLRTTEVIELKKTPESLDQRLRTTQTPLLMRTLESCAQRLKATPLNSELLKMPQLIQTTPKVDVNKTPQLIGPVDSNKPELSKPRTFRITKSKFIEIVDKALPPRPNEPAYDWNKFLSTPKPIIRMKNIHFTVKEVDPGILLLEPIQGKWILERNNS
jgi:hypothetical protein